MDYRNQLSNAGTNGLAERQQSLPFVPPQKDSLLGHATAKHRVLGLEKLNLPA